MRGDTLIVPLLVDEKRLYAAARVRVLTAPLRFAAWLLGVTLGTLCGGFVQGWRDGA